MFALQGICYRYSKLINSSRPEVKRRNKRHAVNLLVCTVHQWRLKHFIIQQMHKYIIRRYNYNHYKIFKMLQHVSDHEGSIIRELYTVLG